MSTGHTHKDLADNELGGCPARWGHGYKWMVCKFESVFGDLIGPGALQNWVTRFPYFADQIRQYICKAKNRVNKHRESFVMDLNGNDYADGNFNIFGLVDCTVYEFC